jgi:hypothetical protein
MEPLTLDQILYQSCYNTVDEEWREYRIETHCLAYILVAKLNPDGKTYTIKSYTIVDN